MISSSMKIRIARPTDDLEECKRFYAVGLGLDVLASFEDHEGFDGVMIGGKGFPWHLEFTKKKGHPAGRAPGADNVLVVYCEVWQGVLAIEKKMRGMGYLPVTTFNPYWEEIGITFEDHDGYRVTLAAQKWSF